MRILFSTPTETKLAFRAIMSFLKDTTGISLVRKPEYAIVLDREKGAWTNWRTGMREMVSDKFMETEGAYYIELCGNSLIPVVKVTEIVPLSPPGNYLPMVVAE